MSPLCSNRPTKSPTLVCVPAAYRISHLRVSQRSSFRCVLHGVCTLEDFRAAFNAAEFLAGGSCSVNCNVIRLRLGLT